MMKRADYHATCKQFLSDSIDTIIGSLASNSFFAVDLEQRDAWIAVIEGLKSALATSTDGYLFLEFTIPRMGRRVDAVLLQSGCVFVLEYKVGATRFNPGDIDQVVGYALDLKNFHEPSHLLPIVPVLIATAAEHRDATIQLSSDGVSEAILSNGNGFGELLDKASIAFGGPPIDATTWVSGRYKPTPTIVEAAQALYRNHRVDDITRNEAGAENLSATATYVSGVIDHSKRHDQKAICFISGVPGSGKTLAGLNIANLRTRLGADEYAVFLSGNGPLVKVLRAALAQDHKQQAKLKTKGVGHATATRSIEQFVQNIHHFRDDNLKSASAPIERVVIFDEAQRAWSKDQATQFMRKKRNIQNFNTSEPEFLLSVMNRHEGWCTVICLIGNGQEINTGEAGLSEWLTALREQFPTWQVHLSDRIVSNPHLFGVSTLPDALTTDERLHLSTSIRSFRSESVSAFASAIVDGEPTKALELSHNLERFDFKITRNIERAREWLRRQRRGTERAGVLAFSNAIRLKPEGIFVKARIEPEDWFLKPRLDIRSSDYLEDIATEFDVQGLELDWACVCIDANLRITTENCFAPFVFRGCQWQAVRDPDRTRYMLNAYRVLLTRARQGVVIFVPYGNPDDHTRVPRWYDDLFDYFLRCGIKQLHE